MSQHVAVYRSNVDTYRLLRGSLRQWFKDKRIPALWTPRLRGFHVRTERVADVVAMLEAEAFRVHVYDREASR